MKTILRTGIAGLAIAAGAATPAGAATVTVRVEGASQTLVRQAVTVAPGTTIDKSGSGGGSCASNTAGGALELATGGDWSGPAYSFGQTVDTIKHEAHVFGSGAYWSFDVNDVAAPVGLCDPSYVPAGGDEILFYPACEQGPAPGCFDQGPLDLHAPATVAPGAPVTVTVDQYAATGEKAPAAGATVTGGGATATTGADGSATLNLDPHGPVTLDVSKAGYVRDEADVCFTSGNDGVCGTPDREPAQARITGITEGRRFRHGHGPRELRATVADDASGLRSVKLSLSRSYHGRCSVLSGKKERFRHARCGSHPRFAVGTSADVSYLLPKRLGPGRYVLDVVTVDKAGNRDSLARGRNRVVFRVR